MRKLLLLVMTVVMVGACSGVSTEEHQGVLEDLQTAEAEAVTLRLLTDEQAAEIEQLEARIDVLESELAAGSDQIDALSEEVAATREVEAQLRALLGSTGQCGAYRGVVCQGYVTDAAGVLEEQAAIETLVGDLVDSSGYEIAVVLVPTTGGIAAGTFADELGNTWGVGDATRNDGVVVLIDVGDHMTWVASGSGLDLGNQYEAIAGAGNAFFSAGEWEEGIGAILAALESTLPTRV